MSTAIITTKPLAVVQIYHQEPVDPVFWPDGTVTHGTTLGYQVGQYMFVSVEFDQAPDEFSTVANNVLNPVQLTGSVLTVTRNWTYAMPLADLKQTLVAGFNDAIETERQRGSTEGSGQAIVYLLKRDQAARCLSDPAPDPADYPLLAATLGIDGSTLNDVAKAVMTAAQAWEARAAALETKRAQAKQAIAVSATPQAAIAASKAIQI